MIDPTNTNIREVLTPDGIGKIIEIAYKDSKPVTAKVRFVDGKGKATVKQYKIEQLSEVNDETVNS